MNKVLEENIDPELWALGLAVDAFKMVDQETAIRMINYLQMRFVIETLTKKAP